MHGASWCRSVGSLRKYLFKYRINFPWHDLNLVTECSEYRYELTSISKIPRLLPGCARLLFLLPETKKKKDVALYCSSSK